MVKLAARNRKIDIEDYGKSRKKAIAKNENLQNANF